MTVSCCLGGKERARDGHGFIKQKGTLSISHAGHNVRENIQIRLSPRRSPYVSKNDK